VKLLQKETKETKVLADGQTFRSGITLLSSFASVEFAKAASCRRSPNIRVHLHSSAVKILCLLCFFAAKAGFPVLKSRLVFGRISGDSRVMEIVFNVTQEGDGGYVAECLSHDIFTQGNTWEELRANVREAVSAYFFDQPKPAAVRLHLVRDELLAGA